MNILTNLWRWWAGPIEVIGDGMIKVRPWALREAIDRFNAEHGDTVKRIIARSHK